MRMKSSAHHAPIILTLCGLQRHCRGARALRTVEHHDSRYEGNDSLRVYPSLWPESRCSRWVLPWDFTRITIPDLLLRA